MLALRIKQLRDRITRMTSVAVIIPFYNGDEYILSCLNSIYSGTLSHCTTYVINNSTQRSNIREVAGAFPLVRVIDTAPRIGFGKACTHGADCAIQDGADFMVFLNQDTIVASECLEKLVDTLSRHQDLAITAPLLYNYDFQGIEEFFIEYYVAQCPSLLHDCLQGRLKEFYSMKKICGACFAIKSSLTAKFGLFDPLYFMYTEDNDLCRRLVNLGYGIGMVPGASVAHVHSHTSANRVLQQKIGRFTRSSKAIYRLKEPHDNLTVSVIKLFIDNISDYANDIFHLRFRKAVSDMVTDAFTLLKLRQISYSRSRELHYLNKCSHTSKIIKHNH
jgi:GT2 family glycosyltransferase